VDHVHLRLRNALHLAVPYWKSSERWRAWALLCVIVLLNLGLVGTTVLFTYWQKAFYNALSAKDWNGFIGSLLWWDRTPQDGVTLGFAPVLLVFVLITAFELYLRQDLQIRWRQWMTDQFASEWLADRIYFRMALTDSGTDNPDQRIAEDLRLYVESTLTLSLGAIRSAVSLISFVFLLWYLSEPLHFPGFTVHGYLVWAAMLYALLGTLSAHAVGKSLSNLHFTQQKAEADFRFSLMRILENIEAVAFHRGEAEQERELSQRFRAVAANWKDIMIVTRRLTFLTSGYAQVILVFPLAVVSPAYFAGRMTLGVVFQASNAFVQVQTALSWIVQSYADLTTWFATVERLATFRRSVAKARDNPGGPLIAASGNEILKLSGMNLMLPDGRSLLCHVDLRIAFGDRLLVRGRSGAGKSTLLRAIAGIWPFAGGIIVRPHGRELFIPQRAYMPLGSLRRALCYPANEADFSRAEVESVLSDIGLGHLATELDATDTWERRLSGGEQQRVAIARALLIKPDWLYMDESTSSLDPDAELDLYELLSTRLPNSAIISVAHRLELARFHSRVVTITAASFVIEDSFLPSQSMSRHALDRQGPCAQRP
jgi:vitamin B12/bleomycin/antimicrobial peptide transport system ATP-binding/permease protein